MSRYPFDLTKELSIDPLDVLDYVRQNKEWFLEHLGGADKSDIKDRLSDLKNHVDSVIDKYDKIRIFRDSSSDNKNNIEVSIYEDIIEIKKELEELELI